MKRADLQVVYEELRRRRAEQGLKNPVSPTLPNRKRIYQTVEEEQAERQRVVEEKLKVFRALLPDLLKKLGRIKDPRNPKKVKHKLTVILLYGILIFVLQMNSRREAAREMGQPELWENLKLLFPELTSLPHHDTLNRLLSRLEEEDLEVVLIETVRKLLRNKKFQRYLRDRHYLIAIDGTQKFSRDHSWTEEVNQRVMGKNGEEVQYYVYVVEANLVLPGGGSIPLASEFLEFTGAELANNKQDCELKAFYRLAGRLKQYFPRLPIMLLLDGLYSNGPVMELCRRYSWEFMIVLQDNSLPSVWKEGRALHKLNPENSRRQNWGNRRQYFWWVNDIEYAYGPNERKRQTIHLVVCEEEWEEVDLKTGEIVKKTSRHAWISSQPLTAKNVHKLCNLIARYRWSIENNILVEKRHGYEYEHCFSYNWSAMKGFHYLMRLAHLLNILAHKTIYLAEKVREMGTRGLIKFFRETLKGPWLDVRRIESLLARGKFQLRLE